MLLELVFYRLKLTSTSNTTSTLRITGSKKKGEERAALFVVRLHAIVRHCCYHVYG